MCVCVFICCHVRVSIEQAGSPFSFPRHPFQQKEQQLQKTCCISHTSPFLFLYMTKKTKKQTKNRRHVLHPCASLTSPVGLVEAAMVAAPEAGVSTLSMAQSHPLYMFTPTLVVAHCVGQVAANLSNLLRGPERDTRPQTAWSLLAL